MSEHQMETRRRSRSKTPFLRSNCDHENCEHAGEEGHTHHHHHHKKKSAAAPNVQTIIEETVEVTSSSAPTLKQAQHKIKTSDYSSDDTSPENKIKSRNAIESQQKQTSSSYSSSSSATTKTTTSTTIISKSKRSVSSLASGATTSTPKANYAVDSFVAQFASAGAGGGDSGRRTEINVGQRFNETAQNEMNSEFERSQKQAAATAAANAAAKSANNSNASNRSKNLSFSRIFGSPFSRSAGSAEHSINGNAGEHIAYREYKRAGEYWKTTPKTDYTYSELSPHRRELAPGVVAMPNMSRRSLENHHERIHHMIQREPAQEDYIRRRYESSKYAQNRREAAKLAYDSGDEVDLTQFEDSRKKSSYYDKNYFQQTDESWFMRIITTVVTTFSSVWDTISGGAAANKFDESAFYQTKIANEERGFFGTIGHSVSSAFLGTLRYIYLFISSVLSFDTWLLQSSNAENKGKKRFLLFLLILLPLLLLTAWQLLDEQERLIYIQRTQALLPVTLYASLRNQLASTGATLKDLLQLPLWSASHSKSIDAEENDANVKLYHIQENMQKSLTPEEYENILNHVNNYVQELVELKLQKQQKAQITPEMTVIIANVMRENLQRVLQERKTQTSTESSNVKLVAALSDEEVQKIAQLVQVKLEATATKWGTALLLTPEHIDQIKQLITKHIEVNNHHFYTHTIEHIDLEALLMRILAAPQLARFVDARIATAIDGKLLSLQSALPKEGSGGTLGIDLSKQQLVIDELNREIAFIKLALSDKVSENQDLHQSISNLKISQDDLLLRMQQHELSTDKRFSALLAGIENKLAALKDEQFTLLNKQIKLSLVEILGFKQSTAAGAQLEDIDLQNWVHNMFVAKEYLEERLQEINVRTNDKIKNEIDHSGMLLMRDISERLKQEILLAVEHKYNESSTAIKGQIRTALSESEVQKIVKGVLAIYDADKTGLVDFALESAGGQILSTRCTESYQTKTAQLSVFGIPLWYPTNTPRVAISPNVQPGECWAFQGFPGFLVLKLNSLVYVTGFTLEHIPKTLAPNGRIESAPRNFTVWGLEHEKDQEPVLFGEYEYVDNDASLQYFPLQNKNIKRPYEIVELRIESNHGHPQYTCLYRFRVHGKPPVA